MAEHDEDTADELLLDIAGRIKRGKAGFGVVRHREGFALFAGSPNAVRLENGFVVSLSMSREQLLELRDTCNALLDPKGGN